MKSTPKSIARAVGNRKLNFALIERQRGNVTETLRHELSRYVTRDSEGQEPEMQVVEPDDGH